jgi:hypothetical protein
MNMSDRRKVREARFSRRTLLKGAGVAMALPWLESIPSFGADIATGEAAGTAAAAAAGLPPKRLAVVFMANGVNPNHWSAKGAGAAMELGKSLAPMEKYKTKMNYIAGLFNKAATGVGIHPGQTGNLLSGVSLTKGAEVFNATTFDQVLANHFAEQTVQPSMVLGCEQPITGYHETNFSMAYSSHISWQNRTSPVPLESYPSKAFDALFENKGSRRNKSILDRVRDQATALSTRVSADDKRKVDEYLDSVRSVEKRIETTRALQEKSQARADDRGVPMEMMKRPENGLPEDIREHMKLMMDIVAMGFQTDKTRIATVMLCRDISGMCYPFLNVADSHHPASHRDASDEYERIVSYYVSQYAYLVGKLDAMKEGNGTVLDNSCIIWMSNMWSGSQHDSTRVPMLTAGGLGGTLETGRVLEYPKSVGDQNRKLCSLYLSLMDRMGVKLDKFGDATTRLQGL